MIYIERNTTNKLCLSLTLASTIPNPYFIFSFQPLATLDTYQPLIYYTAPNISIYTNRYDLFELVEADGGSTTGGNDIPLYLKPGQYEYKAYQSTTDSLDPNTFGTLLETGKMVVGDLTIGDQDTGVDPVYQ